jgi:catechol 2,3-dioxygenase-like lactoylglutathione lyase family enzyme
MNGATLIHVGVRVTDIERSVRFWRDALGLRVVGMVPNGYDLSDGYHNFRVFQYSGPARPDHVSGMQDYLHLGVVVDDLYATARRCLDLGFLIFCDGVANERPFDLDKPGSEAFKAQDPDGIIVDVAASRTQWPGVRL